MKSKSTFTFCTCLCVCIARHTAHNFFTANHSNAAVTIANVKSGTYTVLTIRTTAAAKNPKTTTTTTITAATVETKQSKFYVTLLYPLVDGYFTSIINARIVKTRLTFVFRSYFFFLSRSQPLSISFFVFLSPSPSLDWLMYLLSYVVDYLLFSTEFTFDFGKIQFWIRLCLVWRAMWSRKHLIFKWKRKLTTTTTKNDINAHPFTTILNTHSRNFRNKFYFGSDNF